MTVGIQISKFRKSSKYTIQKDCKKIYLLISVEEKQETMRTVFMQSKSSTMEEEDSRDNSCYYPGCKKDANCDCEICWASFNATRDLMPPPNTSLTKLSASKPNLNYTPISFDSSFLSTPTHSTAYPLPSSTPPVIKSSARSNSCQKIKKQNKGQKRWCFSGVLLLGLGFVLFADIVFSRVVSGIFQPSLSPDVVKRVGEKSSHVQDLNGKLRFLQKELASIVDGKVSNCSLSDSLWEISQDGLLLNSRCTLYKSAIEKVTIWGWPLQTAGMLTTGFSFRTLIILSGRVTEWNGGQVGYFIRKANASWVQPKWGASVVQLDPNTWVLEYQRSSIVDGTRLYSVALEFLKYRISRIVGRVKKYFWLFAAYEDTRFNGFTTNYGLKIPT